MTNLKKHLTSLIFTTLLISTIPCLHGMDESSTEKVPLEKKDSSGTVIEHESGDKSDSNPGSGSPSRNPKTDEEDGENKDENMKIPGFKTLRWNHSAYERLGDHMQDRLTELEIEQWKDEQKKKLEQIEAEQARHNYAIQYVPSQVLNQNSNRLNQDSTVNEEEVANKENQQRNSEHAQGDSFHTGQTIHVHSQVNLNQSNKPKPSPTGYLFKNSQNVAALFLSSKNIFPNTFENEPTSESRDSNPVEQGKEDFNGKRPPLGRETFGSRTLERFMDYVGIVDINFKENNHDLQANDIEQISRGSSSPGAYINSASEDEQSQDKEEDPIIVEQDSSNHTDPREIVIQQQHEQKNSNSLSVGNVLIAIALVSLGGGLISAATYGSKDKKQAKAKKRRRHKKNKSTSSRK